MDDVSERLIHGDRFEISVMHTFQGTFTGFTEENGTTFAIFDQPGVGRFGPHRRKVPIRAIQDLTPMSNGRV